MRSCKSDELRKNGTGEKMTPCKNNALCKSAAT